jgi:RNA polymerase subunit RPABC4/transcription elongation factor Spt4
MVDLGDNFSDSFGYTKKLFKGAGRLIILIVLSIIPIVEWIVLGYMARVLKESPGTGAPPKLENYGQLFVDGAKIFFASLIYLLVPTILIIVGGVGTFASFTSFQGPMVAPAILVGGTGLVVLLIGVILAIILAIILGVGLAHMIKTGKFGNAFAFGEIFAIIRGIGWVKYLGWIVITAIISVVLLAISGAIPYVGSVIAAIVHPILYVFIFRSLGLLYNDGAPASLKAQAPVITGLACASCGTSLQPGQKFCPNCGAAAPTPPPTIPTGTKFCISCGAKIPSTATFCGSCGAKQT